MTKERAQISLYVKPLLLRVLREHAAADGRPLSNFLALHLEHTFLPQPKRKPSSKQISQTA